MRKLTVFAASLSLVATSASAEELPQEARDAIILAFKDKLFDGESARWRWPEKIAGQSEYCGWVNAKNRFGAYVGFKPFLTTIALVEQGWYAGPVGIAGGDTSEEVVLIMCSRRGYEMREVPPE